ncbi:hypothetical protein FBKp18_015 [Klebsiella phage vB_KpP_FBKp18]|uniref:Uncharacterized protein n=1 Tax=Klebsiella phage vB_KpP_FBKp18 TaxID=2982893 RepID=A0A9E8K1S6_9CAUD|nr:hypothetical protein FBKp18_015 [Klebsiella phage vB_KpP_FBKp18]
MTGTMTTKPIQPVKEQDRNGAVGLEGGAERPNTTGALRHCPVKE